MNFIAKVKKEYENKIESSKELSLLIILSNPFFIEKDKKIVNELMQNIEPELFLLLIERHRVVTYIYENIVNYNISLSQEIENTIYKLKHRYTNRMLLLSSEMVR